MWPWGGEERGTPGRGNSKCKSQEERVHPVQHLGRKKVKERRAWREEEEGRGDGVMGSGHVDSVSGSVGCLGGEIWSNLCGPLFGGILLSVEGDREAGWWLRVDRDLRQKSRQDYSSEDNDGEGRRQ